MSNNSLAVSLCLKLQLLLRNDVYLVLITKNNSPFLCLCHVVFQGTESNLFCLYESVLLWNRLGRPPSVCLGAHFSLCFICVCSEPSVVGEVTEGLVGPPKVLGKGVM